VTDLLAAIIILRHVTVKLLIYCVSDFYDLPFTLRETWSFARWL